MTNPRVKTSKKEEWDGREHSIAIHLAPMSVSVFSCTPTPETPKKRASVKSGESSEQTASKKAKGTIPGKKADARGKVAEAVGAITERVGKHIRNTKA